MRVVDQLQSSGTRRDHARRRQVDTARTVRHSGLLAVRSVEASGLRRVTAPTVQPKRADSPKKCPNTTSHGGPDRQVLGVLTRRARRGRHRRVRARLLTCTTMPLCRVDLAAESSVRCGVVRRVVHLARTSQAVSRTHTTRSAALNLAPRCATYSSVAHDEPEQGKAPTSRSTAKPSSVTNPRIMPKLKLAKWREGNGSTR